MSSLAVSTTSSVVSSMSTSPSDGSGTTETWESITNTSRISAHGEIWIGAYWPSFIEHPDAQQATVTGVWLRLAVLPVVLLAGFVGNMLTVALMLRPNMRHHSYSPYLLALAACDSFALVIRALFWVNLLAIELGTPVLVYFRSRPACASAEYLCTANHVLCSWLVVCLTFERLLVVVFPLKSARIVTVKTSVRVVVAMVVCSLVLLSYVPVVVQWVDEAGGCVIRFPQDLQVVSTLQAHFGLATTFVSLLPLLLICCGNFVIVVALYRQSVQRLKLMGNSSNDTKQAPTSSKNRKRESNTSLVRSQEGCDSENSTAATASNPDKGPRKPAAGGGGGGDQQVRRVTVTLLCVCLTFLVLVMPNALLVLTIGLRPDWTSLLPLLDPLALLWDANFAINFYLYVFTGATFRAELFAMLGIRRA